MPTVPHLNPNCTTVAHTYSTLWNKIVVNIYISGVPPGMQAGHTRDLLCLTHNGAHALAEPDFGSYSHPVWGDSWQLSATVLLHIRHPTQPHDDGWCNAILTWCAYFSSRDRYLSSNFVSRPKMKETWSFSPVSQPSCRYFSLAPCLLGCIHVYPHSLCCRRFLGWCGSARQRALCWQSSFAFVQSRLAAVSRTCMCHPLKRCMNMYLAKNRTHDQTRQQPT